MTKKGKKKNNGNGSLVADFKEGDIVGARVKGYPIWPGFIEKVELKNNKPKYTVRFYYTKETSQILAQIKPFSELNEKELACKVGGFKEALSICQKEYKALQLKVGDESKTTTNNNDNTQIDDKIDVAKSIKEDDETSSSSTFQTAASSIESPSTANKLQIKEELETSKKEASPKKLKRLSKKDDDMIKKQKFDQDVEISEREEEKNEEEEEDHLNEIKQNDDVDKVTKNNNKRQKKQPLDNRKRLKTSIQTERSERLSRRVKVDLKEDHKEEKEEDDKEKDKDKEQKKGSKITGPSQKAPNNSLPIQENEKSNQFTVEKERDEEQKIKSTKSPKKDVVPNAIITENTKLKQTLIKLTNKIEMKLKEKEDMKREAKKRKLSDKIFKKLEIINKNLEHFHKLTKVILSEHHIKIKSEWETAVQKFIKTLPALEKCISSSKNSNISKCSSKLNYFDVCRNHLVDLIELIKEFKNKRRQEISDYRLEKLNNIFGCLKKHRVVKEFVNTGYEKFIQDKIGRKENDDK